MSTWIIPKIKDIGTSDDKKEIHIYLGSDDNGNNYVSLEEETLEYIKKLLNKKYARKKNTPKIFGNR